MKQWFAIVMTIILMMFNSVAMAKTTSYISLGDYNEEVIALHLKLSDLGYYHLRVNSPWSQISKNALMVLQENIGDEVTGIVESIEQLDKYISLGYVIGRNMAIGTSDEWSDWFTPTPNETNRSFNVSMAELIDKAAGDYYTCSVEIEFRNVTASEEFRFIAQGAVDGEWKGANVWNNKLINLDSAPQDGIYQYSAATQINENVVNAIKFNLGFRCDNWESGSFRVCKVKVEKGNKATVWVQ